MQIGKALARLLIVSMLLGFVPRFPVYTALAQDEITPGALEKGEKGLSFRLSEGSEKVDRPVRLQPVKAERLSDVETSQLLARMPELREEPDDVVDFKLRDRSLPAPRAGATLQAAFLPSSSGGTPAPAVNRAPLEVLRFAPEGEVALAPGLSITFSQPMVAVMSAEEAATNVPVRLTPQPKGKWHWLGTQTLAFEPDAEGGRFPMATTFTATIPEGTKSALGNILTKARSFTFATPPPAVIRSYPDGESNPRDSIMFLEFDQRINTREILSYLKLQPSLDARPRVATDEEIAANEAVKNLVKTAPQGRWIAFRAVTPGGATANALPGDSTVKVVVPPGFPSAEGPRKTSKAQGTEFKTYGPLRITSSNCGSQQKCSPFDVFSVDFNNQLDTDSFHSASVRVSPDIPNAKITASYNAITIEGAKQSNTIYSVTLDRAIRDNFKQELAGNNQLAFKVTTAEPNLFSAGQGFVVQDPAAKGSFTVYSTNYRRLKVWIYKVTPDDWSQFRMYEAARYNTRRNKVDAQPPGTLVFEKTIDTNAKADVLTETAIDLSPALKNGFGQVFIRVQGVEASNSPVRVNTYRRDNRVEAWVQATNIGLDAFTDKDKLIGWASSLQDGTPLAGVHLALAPDNVEGTTGTDGLARLEFKESASLNGDAILVARRGDDVAILPRDYNSYYHGNETSRWRRVDSSEVLSWYVFDDRKLYRPGEEINIKGWIRKINLTPTGDTEMFSTSGETVDYVLKDSRGNEIKNGSTRLNALAGFNLTLQLPPPMNLGEARISFKLRENGGEFAHTFNVEEFRRPEFEITAKVSDGPLFIGSFATTTTTAAYYTGGGLQDTEVIWTVRSTPTNFTPPNRSDFSFGKFYPWWLSRGESEETKQEEFKGRTDASGKHTLKIDFDGVNPPRPSNVTAEARVQDVNRQTLAATATMLVHPADVYVGLRPARTFVQKGEAFNVAAIVTDLDGKAQAGRNIKLRLVRMDYAYEKGAWVQKEADVRQQTIRSGADAVSARLATTEGGMYRLTAQVNDERGRLNESELSLWVAGGKLPPNRNVSEEKAELIPDRKAYKGGETAEILVQSPFAPAEGVLTLRRSGVLRSERFSMKDNSYTLRIPIEDAMTPNVYVHVDIVGAEARVDDQGNLKPNLPKHPAFASGELNLEIPPAARRLNVTATPREAVLNPGGETVVNVDVKDASGRSVQGTDTAVVVVDESILSLTDYKLMDPLSVFYGERSSEVDDYHLREKIELANLDEVELNGVAREGGGGAGGGGGYDRQSLRNASARKLMVARQVAGLPSVDASVATLKEKAPPDAPGPAITIRQNFNALALFAASLPTDSNGRAQVKVKLPDNLTRYRIMAVSVSGGKLFGTGESAITARQPLMVRPSAPRFLNFGDHAELPVVVQNQTGDPMNVNLAVRSSNAELTEGAGRKVTVPANDRVEVRFPVSALKPGTARFQFAGVSGGFSDAAQVSLPVYTPATTEAFATYGVIDDGATAQPVKAPANAITTFGGLEITTASTQLQELTDAVIYLVHYPYECSEQISSRIMSIAALKDVLTAFKTKELSSPEAMRESVDRDLKRLQGLQNEDGGFEYWVRGERSVPFVSVHVAHALVRAQSKGFTVPAEMLKSSQGYLRDIGAKIPKEYSPESKRAIQAYALYVRALMSDRDSASARKLIASAGGVEKLSLESLGWLLPVLSGDPGSTDQIQAIRRYINNRSIETAGAANFADSYSDGAYTILYSDRRTDGVLLDALIADQPHSDLIPKLVRGLLSNRKQGRWRNTQENVFILLALDRYFNTYEKTTPDFISRVWLGSGYAGEQTFKGRSADRQELVLPMSQLVERTASGPANLTIGKEGAGRLYFRIGAQYAPSNLKLAPADFGFKVERSYEAVDDPSEVKRDSDGVWHIKAGARVRVKLSMFNSARRYHVALVDPLPAGLEALNPELATTERLPDESSESGIVKGGHGISNYYWPWRGPWYEHQNLRDERVEAFTSLLWEGVHAYSYYARATTPGLFIVPPSKAEEMYAPETFGRGQSDQVRVE